MSIRVYWTYPEKADILNQTWRLKDTVDATDLPSESVVLSPQRIMNFDASLLSAAAWGKTAGPTMGLEAAPVRPYPRVWEYRPKRHAVFTDCSTRLAEESIFFPRLSSLFDSLSGVVEGDASEEDKAWITSLSGVGCWVRNFGSVGAGRWATVLFTGAPVLCLDQVPSRTSVRASLKGRRSSELEARD
ncbi:hypothetical protein NDU88_006062 [Pleurodeles waltl]|uniref:Uncharacterized protein n=1 Tax=Pleurodeles waltl TaxID=8319 RepID=A0AAV7X1F1_PLEWA|nr:hypothetical protein NDU88_006062 [Pleurodeles waltl]